MKKKIKTGKKVTTARIVKLAYRRIKNLGNYENEQLEVTVEVPAGMDPDKVLKNLRNWTKDKLHISSGESWCQDDMHEEWP